MVRKHSRLSLFFNYQHKIFYQLCLLVSWYPNIEVPRVDYEKLSDNKVRESNESIRKRVQVARDIQNKRFTSGKTTDIVSNADMRIGEIRQFCQLQPEGQSLMRTAMSQLQLSARVYAQHYVIAFLNWRAL